MCAGPKRRNEHMRPHPKMHLDAPPVAFSSYPSPERLEAPDHSATRSGLGRRTPHRDQRDSVRLYYGKGTHDGGSTDRGNRRYRVLRDGRADGSRGGPARHTLRRSERRHRDRHARGPPGGLPGPSRPGPPRRAVGDQRAGQHLRAEDAGRPVDPVGQRRGQPPGGHTSPGLRHSGPAVRPYPAPRDQLLRRRPRGARGPRRPLLRPPAQVACRRGGIDGVDRARRRYLSLHGRTPVFDQGGIERIPGAGGFRSSA